MFLKKQLIGTNTYNYGKTYETNSSFHVKYGKTVISVFQQFRASIKKAFSLGKPGH